MVDVYFCRIEKDLDTYPNLQAWMGRCRQYKGIKEIMDRFFNETVAGINKMCEVEEYKE